MESSNIKHPYTDLIQATSEQLLESAIQFYSVNNPGIEGWIRLGFALAQPDGWKRVAPA